MSTSYPQPRLAARSHPASSRSVPTAGGSRAEDFRDSGARVVEDAASTPTYPRPGPTRGHATRRRQTVKYMLLMHGSQRVDAAPIHTWAPTDVTAHIQFMHDTNAKLIDDGELVEAQGLAGPDEAKVVRAAKSGGPEVTDGPFPESKEFLAGYW